MTAPLFRTASPGQVDLMLRWAAQEGWAPGLDDATAFRASDPDGFVVALVHDEPVAAISVVNHSDSFAFLGLYLCLPEWRGQGIGLALWNHALAHAGARTVGLDGVASQESNYARSGFVRTGASLRLEGELAPASNPRIRPYQTGDLPRLAQLDEAANGAARPAFLKAWLDETQTRRTVVIEADNATTGFATIRRCDDGAKIGPIIAPDAADALALARAALAMLPTTRAIIDLPSSNRDLIHELQGLGFRETFATARMYRGAPPLCSSRLQAIATMELG